MPPLPLLHQVIKCFAVDFFRKQIESEQPRLRSRPKFLSDQTFQTEIISDQSFQTETNPDQTFQTQVTSDQTFQAQITITIRGVE